ncbi:MAG: STAS domain-containing protein [Egibacteraceae bacterium]
MAEREEPPAPSARVPRPGPIVVVLGGAIGRAAVLALCERVRVALEGCDARVVICDVGEVTDPDIGTVDALARLALTARRLGGEVRLRQACGELQELLALVGLDDVVSGVRGALPVETEG